jgi:DTW domain-containing protein YfiP
LRVVVRVLALALGCCAVQVEQMGRATCQRCSRPDPVCVCRALPDAGKIALKTKVMVVQHPCECKKKMIGTVPLMDLVLSNFELVIARGNGPVAAAETRPLRRTRRLGYGDEETFTNTHENGVRDEESYKVITIESKERKDYLTGTLDNNRSLKQALEDPTTLILYPGPGAVDIESLPLEPGKERTLIVIDGTWRQAGRVMREACIARAVEAGAIRRVQFANAGRSDYKFRKEPKKYCISSLESVAYCLRFLEKTDSGASAVKHLLDTFALMVELQTSFIAKGGVVRDVNREDSGEEDALAGTEWERPGGSHISGGCGVCAGGLDEAEREREREREREVRKRGGRSSHTKETLRDVGSFMGPVSLRAVSRPYALFRQVRDSRTGKNRF